MAGALISTFFAPPCEVQLGFVAAGEEAGRLQDHVHAEIFPGQLGRIALLQNPNLLAAHDDVLVVVTDLAVEFPVNRIPFQKMREGVSVGEIVDRADLRDLVLRHGAQDVAPDAAEAVNAEVCHK